MPYGNNNQENGPESAIGLYPPQHEMLEGLMADLDATTEAAYESIIETICGIVDDSQPVEQYDGSLGVSTAFVDEKQRPVGQLQWDSNLADLYDDPGNVSGVRWCTGTLLSHNLFLSAGHCFDSNPPMPWRVPRIDGTNTPISPDEIRTVMHVNFDYQVDENGNQRPEVEFEIDELVEYRLGGLDIAIVRLAGHPGSLFGMGQAAPADATVGDMMAIIGHPAGVPKRVEAGPVTQFQGDRIRYNDIDTLGGNSGSAIWHERSGKIVGVHTNGGCNAEGTGSNFGVRIERIRAESPTIGRLDHAPFPLARGVYTVRQESSGRFLDAHQSSGNDFSVVTRTAQNNNTQKWRFTPVGLVCTIRQLSSNRYVDAHENQANDFSAVTRTAQANDTQKWVAMPVPGQLSTYTLQQLRNGRFLDAHVTSGADFSVVTRTAQNNDTQQWRLARLPNGSFTVTQVVNGRFMDAHQNQANDFSVVTRTAQNNDTQRWDFTTVGTVYEIEQVSSGRHVDAHENQANDFSVVTRPTQSNDTQRWIATYLGGQSYTLQQLSSGRFLDAHQSSAEDFSVVTRTAQNNDTQRWLIG